MFSVCRTCVPGLRCPNRCHLSRHADLPVPRCATVASGHSTNCTFNAWLSKVLCAARIHRRLGSLLILSIWAMQGPTFITRRCVLRCKRSGYTVLSCTVLLPARVTRLYSWLDTPQSASIQKCLAFVLQFVILTEPCCERHSAKQRKPSLTAATTATNKSPALGCSGWCLRQRLHEIVRGF